MIKRFFLLCVTAGFMTMMNAAPKIDRIEPANWFAGMKNASLQLMVYGQGIGAAEVTTDYPGVAVDSIVRLESPNYLLVYLNLSGAQPGTMQLKFGVGRKTLKKAFELKAREMAGEAHRGFTNADVLYMLMPDRFASGRADNDQIKGMAPYFGLALERLTLSGEGLFHVLRIVEAALELVVLFVQGVLLLLEPVFRIAELVVLLADGLVVLALELEEALLGLEDLLLLDVLAFEFGFLENSVAAAFHDNAADDYIDGQGEDGADDRG